MTSEAGFLRLEDPKSIGVTRLVLLSVLAQILGMILLRQNRGYKEDISDLIPKHITKEDIFATINYNMHLEWGAGTDDDIDHLAETDVSVRLESCYRTSTVSVSQDWSVLFVKE